jgi:hypothetical protein
MMLFIKRLAFDNTHMRIEEQRRPDPIVGRLTDINTKQDDFHFKRGFRVWRTPVIAHCPKKIS